MQHNTCYHEEQDGGHSWCNGRVVPDSWHNSADMVRMYFGHNLKESSLVFCIKYSCITLHISSWHNTVLLLLLQKKILWTSYFFVQLHVLQS